jgi:hypothetical protein
MLMNAETYLNHPTFGLLFRVCLVEENQELFTTLYAQRLFFMVTTGSDVLALNQLVVLTLAFSRKSPSYAPSHWFNPGV